MKKTIIWLIVLVVIGVGIFLISKMYTGAPASTTPVATTTPESNIAASTTPTTNNNAEVVIGTSVEKRDIKAYHFGTGSTEVLFIGGIHGGYEWNTTLVAYELMDYLKANPSAIPANIKVTVIPVLNPDGLNKVTGKDGRFSALDVSASQTTVVSGRFNANTVDLNRNFDCDWQATGTWQNKKVSGGDSAFSEPESQAIKNYVTSKKPTAIITWYSSAGGVYASNCHNGVSAETNTLTQTFAKASGYPAYQDFNFYELTGDMVNWFAKNNIPAISVLLTNHTDTEWAKNLAGVQAVLKYYTK